MPEPARRPGAWRAALLLLLAAGFALRLTAALQQNAWLQTGFPGSWPGPIATLSHDGNTYLRQAADGLFSGTAPAEQRWYRKPFYRPPGASLYFDAALNATGFSPAGFFAVQAALAVAAWALLFLIARAWFAPWIAWASLAAVLFHPVLIFYDASLEDSVPACFLLALALLAFSRHQRDGGRAPLALAGAALALSVAVRPNFLVIPAALAGLAALRARGRDRLLAPLLLLLPAALLLALTARHNAAAGGGQPTGMLVATVGENLFWGNNARPYARISLLPRKGGESPAQFLMDELHARHGGRTPDEAYRLAALAWLRENPGAAAAGFLRKALRHLSAWEIPRNLNLDFSAPASPIFRLPYLPYGTLAALFLLGLAAAARAGGAPLFLAAPFACALVTEVAFFNASRYRSVAIPFMVPLALAGAAAIVAAARTRRFGQFAAALAMVAAGTAAGALAVGGTERRAYLSAEHHKAALVSLRPEARWSHLQEAAALDPDSIEVFDSVQNFLIDSGNARQALALRERGLPACVAVDPVCQRVAERQLRRARAAP